MTHPLAGVDPSAFPDAAMPKMRAAEWFERHGLRAFPVCSSRSDDPEASCNGAGHPMHPQGRDGAGHPLHKVGKTPLVAWSKPLGSRERLRWWQEHRSNIAIATGACGAGWTIVLDFDGPEGAATLADLEALLGRLPPTLEVVTGRGSHRWFATPNEAVPADLAALVGSAASLRFDPDTQSLVQDRARPSGFDLRGQGGYVIAPGSTHWTGAVYRAAGHSIATLPQRWFEALPRKSRGAGAGAAQPLLASGSPPSPERLTAWCEAILRGCCDEIRSAPMGAVNDTINAQALRAFRVALRAGVDLQRVRDELEVAARAGGHAANRVDATVTSAMDAARGMGPADDPGERPRRQPEAAGQTREQRDNDNAPAPAAQPDDNDDERATITVGPDLHRVRDAAIASLRFRRGIFQQFGRGLVRVIASPHAAADPGAPVVADIPQPLLATELSHAAQWLREGRGGVMREVDPPALVVAAVAAAAVYPVDAVPPLRGIVESPALRRDGSVAVARGYDPATELWVHWPGEPLRIPEAPSLDDARDAYSRLAVLFEDFEFRTDPAVATAAIVAAILTPLARDAIDGAAPAFLFASDKPNAGKTLLASVCGLVATGRIPAIRQHTADDDETAKRLAAIALAGHPVALFDNLKGAIEGGALEGALTARNTIGVRVLGRSEDRELPWRTTILLTTNTAEVGSDNERRLLCVSLRGRGDDRGDEHREFTHPDLLAHVAEQRPELLRDAFTILRAHLRAGRPCGVKPLASFEAWSTVVAAAVHWASRANPIAATVPEESRRDSNAARAVVLAWRAAFEREALRVGRALDLARAPAAAGNGALGALRDACADLCGVDATRVTARGLGKRLAAHVVGRTFVDDDGAEVTLREAGHEHGSLRLAAHVDGDAPMPVAPRARRVFEVS